MRAENINDEIGEILIRVFNGEASIEERKKLIQWLEDDPEHSKAFKQSESMWLATGIINNSDHFDYEAAYDQFLAKTKESVSPQKGGIIRFLNKNIYRYAAILLVPLLISTYYYYKLREIGTVSDNLIEVITPKGGKTQIVLSDGTKVWLNSESKLVYPGTFKGAKREVKLEGEGYFAVAKDKEHPFIVKTTDIDVRAVGTEFNVKCYPNEGTIETTLIEGCVVVEKNKQKGNGQEPIVLNKNGRATFIKNEGEVMLTEKEKEKINVSENEPLTTMSAIKEQLIVSEKVNTDPFTAWKSNKLLFDNEAFEVIAYKLERRYGCKILFQDKSVQKYRFSGRFDEISIDQALKALQYASSFKYKIDNDTVRILSENSKN